MRGVELSYIQTDSACWWIQYRSRWAEVLLILMCAPTAVAAARILESLDKNSDPCEDFYQFACGGWISQNPVPESQTSWDQFRALQEKLLVQLRGVWQLQWNSDTFQMPYMHQSIYTSLLDILHESVFHMQDLKLSQRWCWGFRSFRMLRFVTGWIIFWHFEGT